MTHDPSPSARRTRTLPERPSLEHLRNEAKQRLKSLRRQNPQAKLAAVQLALAREYGFASWRQLKAHVDRSDPGATRTQTCFRRGPRRRCRHGSPRFRGRLRPRHDRCDGRTIHQIAKAGRHEAIEILARDLQAGRHPSGAGAAGDQRHPRRCLNQGRVDELRRLLDAHPDLIDARGGYFQKQTALHNAAWRKPARLRRGCCSSVAPTSTSRLSPTTPCASPGGRGCRSRDGQDAGRGGFRHRAARATITRSACLAGRPAFGACARTWRRICCAAERSSTCGLQSPSTAPTTCGA